MAEKSIGGQIAHFVHHGAHQVAHVAHDAVHGAEHAAHDAKHGIIDTADDIAHTSEVFGHDLIHALDVIKHAEGDAEGKLKHFGVDLETGLKGAADILKKEIDMAGDAVLDKIEDYLKNDLTAAVLQKALAEAHDFLHGLDQSIKSLQKTNPTLLDLIDDVGDSINLGPVVLNYKAFFSRVADLVEALNALTGKTIEVRRSVIIDLITALGPSSVTINANIQLFSTFGTTIPELPIQLFTEFADMIMEKLGVPE